MRAYHIRTVVHEHHELNLIYVRTEPTILVGFWQATPRESHEGRIEGYSLLRYAERAESIIDGCTNQGKDCLVGKIDLSLETIDKIRLAGCKGPEVRTTRVFDGTTDCLVGILSGELIEKPPKKGFLDRLLEYVIG